MTRALLSAAELRFINLVASRRFRGGDPAPESGLEQVLDAVPRDATPHRTAAALAAGLLQRRVFPSAATETALLALTCQLFRDGLELFAPQGAVVGMVQGLASGRMDEATVARWLEDRALAPGSG